MEISEIKGKYNFIFKKSLGQNFITDKNLLSAITADAGITREDSVIEIGAGAGTLTRALAEKAGKVFAFEIDTRLEPILKENLSDFDNVELIFEDVLKLTDEEILKIAGGPFKVVANLPYYVTTPMIMRFIESSLPVRSLTVTVQKEVAERLIARAGTPEFGAITLQVKIRADVKITRKINRELFYPRPEVDSAVVRIDLIEKDYPPVLKKIISAAFSMRRKTLVNNLNSAFGIPKEEIREALLKLNYKEDIRGETLEIDDYLKIAVALNLVS
jgi:dimethyladenosine transferase